MDRNELQEQGGRVPTISSLQIDSNVEPGNGGQPKSNAWLRVLGCFFVFVNSYGLASSFGVYQAYYETELLSSYSVSAISWIGTTQLFLLGFVGVLSGPLCDRGYGQALLIAGCSMVVLGVFMTSVAKRYWQILLCQGFCIGIGTFLCCLLMQPLISVQATV